MKSDLSFWKNRSTFVTGATGFIGGWLVRRLVDLDAQVTCIDRNWVPGSDLVRSGLVDRVKVVRGDICDPGLIEQTLSEQEIVTVLHLAAQPLVGTALQDPAPTFETNIKGTWTILEACRKNRNVRQIVVASSDKAYGTSDKLPYREEMPLAGEAPYEVSKSCADLITQAYAKTYGLPVVISRCGNIYGGGDPNWNRIVPGTVRSILLDERPIIRSDGTPLRDYFYVEDGAAVYTLLAEQLAKKPKFRGEAFNFSNEMKVTTLEIVERILKLMGSNLKPVIQNVAVNEIENQSLSSEKARELLDWKCTFDLDEGLKRTIEWYREFIPESQKKTPVSIK
jgi:CDP-glucose 4,6-dehydratase